MINILEHQR